MDERIKPLIEKKESKMKIKVIIALLFIGIFAFGCAAKHIVYIPDPASINDPKTIIWFMILEQPEILIPQDLSWVQFKLLGLYFHKVEVTDDKFKVVTNIRLSAKPFSGGSVLNTSVIYYDNIGSVELYKFRDYYTILIKNESRKVIYRVATYDLDKAKSFVDALHVMMNRR
jgi:hypothetical protein